MVFPATMTAGDVINASNIESTAYSVPDDRSLQEAARRMISSRVSCLIATNNGMVSGVLSERDVLKALAEQHLPKPNDLSHRDPDEKLVSELMTPANKLITAGSEDTCDTCLSLMVRFNVRHLPVVDKDAVVGVLSYRELISMSPAFSTPEEEQGKKGFMNSIIDRRGLPPNTFIQDAIPSFMYLSAGASNKPADKKKATGGEDSHFVFLDQPDEDTRSPFSMIGVFDGVGTWTFEHGIDAALFSRNLASTAMETLAAAAKASREAKEADSYPPSPMEVLNTCWESIKNNKIQGGSTATLVSLSGRSRQLNVANLGDSGIYVLRKAGSFWNKSQHSPDANPDGYHIVYQTTPQLHYFNCPAQLGLGLELNADEFEKPSYAHQNAVPVLKDDLIIVASDGLFDNMTEEQVVEVVSNAIHHFCSPARSFSLSLLHHSPPTLLPPQVDEVTAADREASSPMQSQELSDAIAKAIVDRAYELSVDRDNDGPFAQLAKDEGILWRSVPVVLSDGFPSVLCLCACRS